MAKWFEILVTEVLHGKHASCRKASSAGLNGAAWRDHPGKHAEII